MVHVNVSAMQYRYNMNGRQLMGSSAASTNDLGEYRIFALAPTARHGCEAGQGAHGTGSGEGGS